MLYEAERLVYTRIKQIKGKQKNPYYFRINFHFNFANYKTLSNNTLSQYNFHPI